MITKTINVFTFQEQKPLYDVPVIIQLDNGRWYDSQLFQDNEYGDVFDGYEEYIATSQVRFWYYHPTI